MLLCMSEISILLSPRVAPVVSIRVCRDQITRLSLGYAYVNYNHAQDVFIQLKSLAAAVEDGDTLSLNTSLSGNRTIISKNGTFELGFFSPNGNNNWYIGIWYANIIEKTYVWVANRENPAKNRAGVLKLLKGGDLVLFDAEGASLWAVNVTKMPSQAVILDSGNFVTLSDANNSEIVWQSFDYPTDTWLPGIGFGGQQNIVSWKNTFDPAPELFSLHVDSKQFVLTWNHSKQYWTSGTWDGNVLNQAPEMSGWGNVLISVEDTKFRLYATYTTKIITDLSHLVLVKSGGLQQFSPFADDRSSWNTFWCQPREQCTIYGLCCGAYGSCNSNNLQFCVDGFTPKDKPSWDSRESWVGDCIRQNPLNCDAKKGSTDGFPELRISLPDGDSASSYPATTKKDCEKACLLNCSCTAFTFNPPKGSCQIWSGDLLNMRNSLQSKSNLHFSIRVAASANSRTQKSSSLKLITTTAVVGAVAVSLCIFLSLMWRTQCLQSMERLPDSTNSFLRMYSYMELKIATRNFKSKLGSGGFGTMYKGHLIDGTLVAVKKMKASKREEKAISSRNQFSWKCY